MLTLIVGGARSGKSSKAQQLALHTTNHPVYLATARHWDNNFEQRIERHRQERDDRWQLIEEEKNIGSLPLQDYEAVVIDCVTLWLTNIFVDTKQNVEQSLAFAKQEIDKLKTIQTHIIVVSNELGMGLHAETEIGRLFTDLQGWTNQYIASKADKVLLMVCGIPMTVK